MAKSKEGGLKILGENRKARYNYSVDETLECGIELKGTEVKSMKLSRFSFPDAFCEIRNGQLFVKNLHITPYDHGNLFNHDPDRTRRLLAHKAEILKLERKVNEKGFTLIPLKFYLKDSRVKVEIGVCKGKKLFDKRDSIKTRELNREEARHFRKS
jgi:SsrA-binding protein